MNVPHFSCTTTVLFTLQRLLVLCYIAHQCVSPSFEAGSSLIYLKICQRDLLQKKEKIQLIVMKYPCNMHRNVRSSFQKKKQNPNSSKLESLENFISLALVESFTSVASLLPLDLSNL